MKKTRYSALIVAIVFTFLALAVSGSQEPRGPASDRTQFVVVVEQLRLAIYVATLAVLSPTIADQRLHAQQVINILEGKKGRDFVPIDSSGDEQGLISRARSLFQRVDKLDLEPKVRERVRATAERIAILFKLAREESLCALKTRQLTSGAESMLKVYAYLVAALGREASPTYLGGLLMLARLMSISPDKLGSLP